jgi:hypothetical protein
MNEACDICSAGDVFQISEEHGRAGWIGAFVLSTEVKKWGIKGFVHIIKGDAEMASAHIRLEWKDVEYIGHANLVPKPKESEEENGNTSD